MTKEKFCEIINQLNEGERLQQKVASAVRQYNSIIQSDYPEPFGMVIAHDSLVIDLLSEIMDDKYNDIEYYCYDLEYGRLYNPGDVTDEEGNEVELRTPENLYDFLIKLKENKN